MLSIQAVRGLPRLRAPGIVPCIISFSRQLPRLLMVWPEYASFLALTVSSSSLFTPALLRTHMWPLFIAKYLPPRTSKFVPKMDLGVSSLSHLGSFYRIFWPTGWRHQLLQYSRKKTKLNIGTAPHRRCWLKAAVYVSESREMLQTRSQYSFTNKTAETH